MRKGALILIILWTAASAAYALTADTIIQRVDKKQEFRTETYTARMIITKGKRRLIKTFTGYAQNLDKKSFISFTNREDRGVKYLKIKKKLWIYFPDADSIMKISGHMLRQGMMGSDISYEDMLENDEFHKKYRSIRLKDIIFRGKNCFQIELKAQIKTAPYARQVLYIDKKLYVPLKVEKYARGGRLLKVATMHDLRRIAGRDIPMKIIFKDLRKRNSKTVIFFESVRFDVALPRGAFTRRNLRR